MGLNEILSDECTMSLCPVRQPKSKQFVDAPAIKSGPRVSFGSKI
jgi:hypothetical protein